MNALIQLFSRPDVQAFVAAHKHNPPAHTALALHKKTDFDLPTVVQQIAIWQKATEKIPRFAQANCLLTPKMYEQCTAQAVAAYKKTILPPHAHKLLELTAGTGVDAHALSQNFEEIHLIEPDQNHLELLKHNFELLGVQNAHFYNQTAEDFIEQNKKNHEKFSAIYTDPDRRPQAQRTTSLTDGTPNIPELLPELLQIAPIIYLKTSPMIDITQACTQLNHQVQRLWVIAWQGEVKEILFEITAQTNAQKPHISAVEIDKNNNIRTLCSLPTTQTTQTMPPPAFAHTAQPHTSQYLYQPHATAIKAAMVQQLAAHHNLNMLHHNTAYLFGNELIIDFFGKKFAILHTLKYQPKTIKKQLDSLHITQANIAARNFYATAPQLIHSLKLKSGGSTHLFFTTDHNKTAWCFVCEKTE